MEDLLKAWEKEYRHFEKLKETEIRHIQSVKINARALQLKYCIKALKKQLTLTDVGCSSDLIVVELSDNEIKLITEKELKQWQADALKFDGFEGWLVRGRLVK